MDRDPQTAEALHELVSQWPEEAKQIGLDFNDYENGYRPHWTLDHGTREFCPLNYAIDLHIASGLRWLIEHTTSFHMMRTSKGEISIEHFGLGDRAEWTTSFGPTLFLALHAAILAAKENA